MLGINDFAADLPIGVEDDFDSNSGTDTLYGCIRNFTDYLKSVNPAARISLCTINRAYGFNGYLPTTSDGVNANLDTIADFNTAITYCASTGGFDVIDIYNKSGFSQENLKQLCIDSALHPNNIGMSLISNVFVSYFKSSIDSLKVAKIYGGNNFSGQQIIGDGVNNDFAIGTSSNNRLYIGTYGDNFNISLNRSVVGGTFYKPSLPAAAIGIFSSSGDSNIRFQTSNLNGVDLGGNPYAREAMRITKNQEVLIGTATPSTGSKLVVDGKIKASNINFSGILEFADNAAAITGGLVAGDLYRDSSASIKIVL